MSSCFYKFGGYVWRLIRSQSYDDTILQHFRHFSIKMAACAVLPASVYYRNNDLFYIDVNKLDLFVSHVHSSEKSKTQFYNSFITFGGKIL